MAKYSISTDGYIEDDSGKVIAFLADGSDKCDRDILWRSAEMFEAINEFIADTDNGSLKAKKAYNKFKSIIKDISVYDNTAG